MNKKMLLAVLLITGITLSSFVLADDLAADKPEEQPFLGRGFFDAKVMDERAAAMQERMAIREELDAAIESGDYALWVSIMEENDFQGFGMPDEISEENFALLQELHQLRNREMEIMGKLGFPEREQKGRMWRRGGFEGKGLMNGDCPLTE